MMDRNSELLKELKVLDGVRGHLVCMITRQSRADHDHGYGRTPIWEHIMISCVVSHHPYCMKQVNNHGRKSDLALGGPMKIAQFPHIFH
jgi:hypothetical protein